MLTMNTLNPEPPPIIRPQPSAIERVPPGSDVQPITEAQFAAIVRRYEAAEADGGTVYTKDGQPWEFTRKDSFLIVAHRTLPLPHRYYEIV